MDSNKTLIAALLFIVMILGANFIMYGIVRGFARGGKKNMFETLGNAFNPAKNKQKDPMEDLREKAQGIIERKKEDGAESK